jgi:hypothetical protein
VKCCSRASRSPCSSSPSSPKKLNPAQQKYSAYDRDLLAIYQAVMHFRHTLEVHHFIIFIDHKPIIHAFSQKPDNAHRGNLITSTL